MRVLIQPGSTALVRVPGQCLLTASANMTSCNFESA